MDTVVVRWNVELETWFVLPFESKQMDSGQASAQSNQQEEKHEEGRSRVVRSKPVHGYDAAP